jgi:hypothetical protein
MKNRSIKELLEVMLDNQGHFCDGLCSWVSWLKHYEIVNNEESMVLRRYIDNNRPSTTKAVDVYYWPVCEKEPRVNWINEHIKLNS